jgi:hypothetical protein
MTVEEFDRRMAKTCASTIGVLQAMVEAEAVPVVYLPLVVAALIQYRETMAEARAECAIDRAKLAARADA